MSEQIESKRGRGRPRKMSAPEPERTMGESLTVNIMDIAHDIGDKSRGTARRLVNTDSEFPPAFKINGVDYWMREDWIAYLKMKAQRARETKQAHKRAKGAE